MTVTKEQLFEKMERCKEKRAEEIEHLSEKIFSKLDEMHVAINKIDKANALSSNDILALQDVSKKIVPRWAFTWTVVILVGVASGFGTYAIGRVGENAEKISQVELNAQKIAMIEKKTDEIAGQVTEINKFFSKHILTIE